MNFRTGKESYKDRRRTKNPREEWKVFENTHPAIVDEETWNLAQHCRETKRRPHPDSLGEANPLTGLLFCADCGAKLYNHRKRRTEHLVYHRHIGKYYPSYGSDAYCCANFRSNARSLRDCCTMHYIRTAAVRELLLDTIKNVSAFVKKSEAEFIRQVREASELRQEAAAKASRKQLAKDQKRHAELDTVISKLFEQSAAGKIPEARFDTLLAGYEKEQAELAQSVERLKAELQTFDADSVRADKFIELVKKYTDFTELTTPMIHEFVEKVIVHEADRTESGRVQQVDIYLNFIGKFDVPMEPREPSPEEIAEMEKLQKRRARIRANNRRFIEKRQREMAANEHMMEGGDALAKAEIVS